MRIALFAALALAACAKSPDAIAPAYVSDVGYRGLTCAELAVEESRINTFLVRASTQQENARANDAAGVFWLGVPVSTMSGDNVAPEIARLKGELEAISRVQAAKRCRTT